MAGITIHLFHGAFGTREYGFAIRRLGGNPPTAYETLNIKGDGAEVTVFATAGQLQELADTLNVYLAGLRAAEAADGAELITEDNWAIDIKTTGAQGDDISQADPYIEKIKAREEVEKPKYVCPNSQQHTRDGKGSGGFRVITDDVPEPHVAKIVCSVCGAHIKWESKAERGKREAMTLNAGKDECEGEEQ